MSKKEKKTVIAQEDIMKILDSCYEKCLKFQNQKKKKTFI